jgi:hypothetical protein
LQEINDRLQKAVKKYLEELDPQLKVIYRARKDYESTVTLINEKISEYIEFQQDQAQKMFPHYFEKYKTDGVEYNIYIGQSLVQNKEYNPIYLQNLRLWQLLVTCGVENLTRGITPQMKTPLEITSLLLVHSQSLAVKFRMDEKQFDVDGAYNIRYEIVKKRIDKAFIKGTNERLTQPGKIAIVYSQDGDMREYLKYLDYLQSIKAIGPEIEHLELEDLQETAGLKALRVEVIYDKQTTEKALKVLAFSEA